MRLLQLALLTSVLVVTLSIAALGVGVTLASQAVDPLQLSLSIGRSHEATFYVGYDPGLWCTVGEQRAIGLSLVDTTSRQSTRLIAIPLGPQLRATLSPISLIALAGNAASLIVLRRTAK